MNKEILSPLEQSFCKEYIIDYKESEAAIRAGYDPKTAEIEAADLLRKDETWKYIENLRENLPFRLKMKEEAKRTKLERIVDDKSIKTSERLKAAEALTKRVKWYKCQSND